MAIFKKVLRMGFHAAKISKHQAQKYVERCMGAGMVSAKEAEQVMRDVYGEAWRVASSVRRAAMKTTRVELRKAGAYAKKKMAKARRVSPLAKRSAAKKRTPIRHRAVSRRRVRKNHK